MSDLIERLRNGFVTAPDLDDRPTPDFAATRDVMRAAADALTEQAAEIDRLREALGKIELMKTHCANATVRRMSNQARAALNKEPTQ